MEATTQTEPTTREKLEAKATTHRCPLCGEQEAVITVNLASPTEFHCGECDGDFSIDEVEALIDGAASWKKTIGWLLKMPAGMRD